MRQQNICLHALGGGFGNTHSLASLELMNVLNNLDLSERLLDDAQTATQYATTRTGTGFGDHLTGDTRLQGLAELFGSATQDGFAKLPQAANDGRYEEARRAV